MDSVKDAAFRGGMPKTCKCVVWDLDNTIWQGTPIEDGPDALGMMKSFGLDDSFLFPQIS
jgi:predicted enzyme involved in methoxymalonyl-ACP biosynthesis